MSVSPLWLRALLSIAVIFNGSLTTAGSMVGMSPAGVAASETADTVTAETASALCHEDNFATVETSDFAKAVAHDHDGTPDCCKAGSCRCACAHATATVEFVALPGVSRANTPPPVVGTSDDVVQPVARLDRPPIA
ncbi:MAG: CopL family metal-binding regulatory protein [Dokdonella sp.]